MTHQPTVVVGGVETHRTALEMIDGALARAWVIQFLIDARPQEDRRGIVRQLLDSLAAAAARGVDTRVLLAEVAAGPAPEWDANFAAAAYLMARGVQVRGYRGTPARPHLHAKLLVVDDQTVLAGSANWTARAFTLNVEVGAVAQSPQLGLAASRWHARLWTTSDRVLDGRISERARPHGAQEVERATAAAVKRAAAVVRTHPKLTARAFVASHLQTGTAPRSVGVADSPPILLAGQPFLRAVRAAAAAAKHRIWINAFGLATLEARRLRGLGLDLVAAAARGVDVRILYDARGDLRNVWAADSSAFAQLGVAARPWPLLTRMHARAILVDDTTAFIGSVGLTPRSIFLTEELAVAVADRPAVAVLAARFAHWWHLATTHPRDWPVGILVDPEVGVPSALSSGFRSLGDVLDAGADGGGPGAALEQLRIAADWVVRARFAPPVARLLGRANVRSLGRWNGRTDVDDIDRTLLPGAGGSHVLASVPAATYIARRILGKEV